MFGMFGIWGMFGMFGMFGGIGKPGGNIPRKGGGIGAFANCGGGAGKDGVGLADGGLRKSCRAPASSESRKEIETACDEDAGGGGSSCRATERGSARDASDKEMAARPRLFPEVESAAKTMVLMC